MVRQAVQKTMGLQNTFATELLAIVVLLSPWLPLSRELLSNLRSPKVDITKYRKMFDGIIIDRRSTKITICMFRICKMYTLAHQSQIHHCAMILHKNASNIWRNCRKCAPDLDKHFRQCHDIIDAYQMQNHLNTSIEALVRKYTPCGMHKMWNSICMQCCVCWHDCTLHAMSSSKFKSVFPNQAPLGTT